jgi:23S rRNA pseudouridine2605 synthase
MARESTERLHKVLAHAGVASRRKAETLILQGRVTVNGRVVKELGTKVDAAHDEIQVDGQRVKAPARHMYILLNKPSGVLSSMEDPRGRKSLGDLVTAGERLFPVGRLDVTSEGLILLTDDGDLANILTHPSYEHEKEYRVLVNGTPSDETLDAWRRGVVLDGERTAPAGVDITRKDKDGALLRIVMHEGRKRQIRSVAELLGHPVRELQRVRIGPLRLGTLRPGQWRPASEEEVAQLMTLKKPSGRPKGRKPQDHMALRRTVKGDLEGHKPQGRTRGQRPAGQPAARKPQGRTRAPRPEEPLPARKPQGNRKGPWSEEQPLARGPQRKARGPRTEERDSVRKPLHKPQGRKTQRKSERNP